MRSTFARRLMIHSILTIGGSLTLLMIGIMILFFSIDVEGLNGRIDSVRARIPEALRIYDIPTNDPERAARIITSHVDSFGMRIVVFDNRIHVIATASDPYVQNSPVQFQLIPNNRPAPETTTLMEQFALGLATALGSEKQHLSADGVNVELGADPAVLARIVHRLLGVLFIFLVVIGVFAYIAAHLLNREALRPLEEVVAALDAFAEGDLRPRHVEAASHDEFGRLAAAYNGAVERVAAAFRQRDQAEAEIRRFTADAAHQLRTPLTVIQGFIGILLKDDARTQADRERILGTMDRQSRCMGALIEKLTLLDRWHDAQASPQIVDVGDCVAAVVQPLVTAFPDRELTFTQDPACYAFVDPTEIREALGNVVDNALKYASPAPVSVAVQHAGENVRVVVSDAGPGLTQDELAHAFERFYRGDHRDVTGSGLGLSIAKRAVERAGGTISIDSRRGAGTKVTIALPCRAA